ncbi:MAG: CinA family protein [Anaerolineae bacterium]
METHDLGNLIAEILVEREMTVGTIECGVDGIVSHRFFETDVGPDVLGSSLVTEDLEEAIVLLDLPRPQLQNKGDFSAKAARAAARKGRAFLGVSLCVAVWAKGPTLETSLQHPVHLALSRGGEVIDQTVRVMDGDHLVQWAFKMMRETLRET